METDTGAKNKPIVIERTFDLPVSTVWKAWTDPETYKKWWGPKNYTCPHCSIDLRVDGKYLSSMKDKKTGEETWGTGTYKEIVPQKKLVMTDSFADSKGNITAPPASIPGAEHWPGELMVTVEMHETNGKTDFRLTHADMPIEMYEDCIAGWQECFDKLESNLK